MKYKIRDLIAKTEDLIFEKLTNKGVKNRNDYFVDCKSVPYPKHNILFSKKLKVIVCDVSVIDRHELSGPVSFVGNLESGLVDEIKRLD